MFRGGRPVSGVGDAPAIGVGDRLGAVRGPDLGEEIVDVGLDRGLTDEQAAGDLGVGLAAGDEAQDLGLPRGQPVGQSPSGRPGAPPARVSREARSGAALDRGVELGLAPRPRWRWPGEISSASALLVR